MIEITFDNLPQAVSRVFDKLETIERLLLSKESESQPEPDELLTVQQVASFLNLSVPTIYGLSQRHSIPVCKRGKRLYFSKQQLTEWIKAGRKKTIDEIVAESKRYTNKKGLNNGK